METTVTIAAPGATKGLSALQRRILQLAVAARNQYGDDALLYQAEILSALHGWPSNASLRDVGRKFDRLAIGAAEYNRATAAVSRATGRLVQRGLLDYWVSQRAGGAARYSLTASGWSYATKERLIESHRGTLLTVGKQQP
jgi:hypothetical protein